MSEIGDLFTRDPLSLTKENIDAIIETYRKARTNFNLGEKSAGSTKKVTAPKGPKITKIDLGDLGL